MKVVFRNQLLVFKFGEYRSFAVLLPAFLWDAGGSSCRNLEAVVDGFNLFLPFFFSSF